MQASEVLELVRFPTMSEHELCEAAKHPVVLKDSKVKVSLGCILTIIVPYMHAFHPCR